MKKNILITFGLFFLSFTLGAKTIKVGRCNSEYYFSNTQLDGSYAEEYLNKIAQYTGWEYEYIDGNWADLLQLLQYGGIQLMPGVSISSGRAALFNFPNQPMGLEKYYLYKLQSNKDINTFNIASLEGKKIGVLRGSVLYESLVKWVSDNFLKVRIIIYNDNKKIIPALKRGDLDLVCETDLNIQADEGLVPLFQTGMSQFYLAASKTDESLIYDLNSALNHLEVDEPRFTLNLRNKYLTNIAVEKALMDFSRDDKEKVQDYLASHGLLVFIFFVLIILVIVLSFTVYIHQILKNKRAIERSREKIDQQLVMLKSLSNIYLTTHLFDLKTNTFRSIKDYHGIEPFENYDDAKKSIRNIMEMRTTDAYRQDVLDFVDLDTLPERLKDKQSISMEFLGRYLGWMRISFIRVTDENVLYTTQVIDEEKKKADNLKRMSRIDSLTGIYNRNGFDIRIGKFQIEPPDESRTFFMLDLDGLKRTNDAFGHDAGDEIIVGTASIIKNVFGDKGNYYRIGGDEFAVIISADKEEIQKYCERLESEIAGWKGEKVSSLHLSYGLAGSYEYPDYDANELLKVADSRMYEMKRQYYASKNADRRQR